MNSTMRVVLGIGVVVVAVVLLVVLKDDGGDSSSNETTTAKPAPSGNGKPAKPAEPPVTTIVIDQDGKPVGGIAEISLDEGEEVRFKVESAVSDEIHMHGYDIGKDVEAGGSVSFDFPATIEGVFEAELESRGEQILELRVNP
jgi:hypothetical protein